MLAVFPNLCHRPCGSAPAGLLRPPHEGIRSRGQTLSQHEDSCLMRTSLRSTELSRLRLEKSTLVTGALVLRAQLGRSLVTRRRWPLREECPRYRQARTISTERARPPRTPARAKQPFGGPQRE